MGESVAGTSTESVYRRNMELPNLKTVKSKEAHLRPCMKTWAGNKPRILNARKRAKLLSNWLLKLAASTKFSFKSLAQQS
jgi:hypothetical protein